MWLSGSSMCSNARPRQAYRSMAENDGGESAAALIGVAYESGAARIKKYSACGISKHRSSIERRMYPIGISVKGGGNGVATRSEKAGSVMAAASLAWHHQRQPWRPSAVTAHGGGMRQPAAKWRAAIVAS